MRMAMAMAAPTTMRKKSKKRRGDLLS